MSENNASTTYAIFKIHSNLNETESKSKGRAVYDDIEVCEIRFSGNKQTVGVFPALELAEWGENPLTGERERITYAQKYNAQYLMFKAGEAQVAHGTPLEELTSITQGKRLELKALNIHTVEALSDLDGNNLKMLGMGGRDLKNQAKAFLDLSSSGADNRSILAENEKLKKQIAALTAKQAPKTSKGKGKPDDIPDQTAADAETEMVDKADDATATIDPTENPFSDWEADDIKLWLMDAEPELDIDGRWGKETLAEKAKEVNDKIAAAKKA